MWVPVKARIGWNGFQREVASVWLEPESIGIDAGCYGAAHVLEMGQHYHAYVVTGDLPQWPVISGFNPAHPYVLANGKIRCAGVTGNIGETVTAIVARRLCSLDVQQ